MRFKTNKIRAVITFFITAALISDLLGYTDCYSGAIARNGGVGTGFSAFSFASNHNTIANTVRNERPESGSSKIHTFELGGYQSEIHCGEIVLGTPLKRNDDGSVLVDIGRSQPLVASKNSMHFMNEAELEMLNTLLDKKEADARGPNPMRRMIYETIHMSKKFPERKRKTYFNPRYLYPYDFANSMKKKDSYVPYDIGVGGEIRPQDYSKPPEPKTPEFLKNRDKMEFVVTDIDTYSNEMKGEFFSVNIVESKRRVYASLFLESLGRASQFTPYDGVITEIMDDVVKVQLLSGRHPHVRGVNAFAMANPKDKPGDRIKVYLAGGDVGLEHVYLFRSRVPHPMLRKETMKVLIDSMIKYYATSGRWFKAEVEKVINDMIVVRLFGQNRESYLGYATKDCLPYNHPEGLLNEAFLHHNRASDYVLFRDAEINIGKMNYIYHYDNSVYTRVDEMFVKDLNYNIARLPDINNELLTMSLTTKNYYKPSPEMEKYFIKMMKQKGERISIETGRTYPCIVIGNDGGYLYFAINSKFKSNFTLEDEYSIGVMEAGQYSTNVAVGTIVHVKLSQILKYKLDGQYMVETIGKKVRLKKLPITEWLSRLSDEQRKELGLENTNYLTLLVMNNYISPRPEDPQFTEFLFLQPLMNDTKFANYVEAQTVVEAMMKTNVQHVPVFPASTSSEYEKPFRPHQSDNMGEVILIKDYLMAAPPVCYKYNSELRQIFLKENLEPEIYSRVMRNIDEARFPAELIIREFFVNIKGLPYWEFLESLRKPLVRRKVTLKLAQDYERSILKLLSIMHTLHLESLYEKVPKEEIMFASIVPNSNGTTFFSIDDLREFYEIVRRDFVMDRKVNRSILNVLGTLTHPSYSFMAQLRNRHRRMGNDVFFYSSKSINYDVYVDLQRPFVSRLLGKLELEVPYNEEESSSVPMSPISDIVSNPKSFVNQLKIHGLDRVKKLYSDLLRLNEPYKAKFIRPRYHEDDVEDYEISLHNVDVNPREVEAMFQNVDINEYALNNLDFTKEGLKHLRKAWRRLNRYPTDLSRRDLEDYLEDIKKVNQVHGIKLPIF